MTMAEISDRDPQAPPEADPIVTSSLSAPILLAAVLLLGTLVWALWDEVYGQRPWKDYQQRFVAQYERHLRRVRSRQAANAEKEVRQSPEYQRLESDFQ